MASEVDVIDLLERDHRLIDELAERLDTEDDPDEIRRLYVRIVEALTVHEEIEQEILFPAFLALVHSSSDTTLERRLGEHEELNGLLAEMRELDPNDYAFIKRGSALLLEVEGHFAREEDSVFARMRAECGPEVLAALGERALLVHAQGKA
ncbi:MAG TPA: hemerythrin domain-containing protein [Ilumatobacteraceae bacterium]|jgi:hypothetical protein